MNARALLDSLRARGVDIAPDGDDQLSLDAPSGVLTPKVLSAVAGSKSELLALLRNEAEQGSDQRASKYFEAPEPPIIPGATWDGWKCVWRFRLWFLRSRKSIALERAILEAQAQADDLQGIS
jgi:hypothetical protein